MGGGDWGIFGNAGCVASFHPVGIVRDSIRFHGADRLKSMNRVDCRHRRFNRAHRRSPVI